MYNWLIRIVGAILIIWVIVYIALVSIFMQAGKQSDGTLLGLITIAMVMGLNYAVCELTACCSCPDPASAPVETKTE